MGPMDSLPNPPSINSTLRDYNYTCILIIICFATKIHKHNDNDDVMNWKIFFFFFLKEDFLRVLLLVIEKRKGKEG